jgi:acetyl esterase/lipase
MIGGGYVIPAQPNYLEFMYQLYELLTKDDKDRDIAILFLSYGTCHPTPIFLPLLILPDLAPSARYPRQLQQAALLLTHVLDRLHKRPENIILTGDSAGGNLALALLSHISHPHPSTTHPILPVKPSAPFRGCVLTSPWLDFSTSKPSFTSNAPKDYLTIRAGNLWSSTFMGTPAPHTQNADPYIQAIMAPESWWKGVMVQEFLIMAGQDELLVDGIVEFAEGLKRVKGLEGRVQVLVAEGEAHDATNGDVSLGFTETGKQGQLMRSWISSKL